MAPIESVIPNPRNPNQHDSKQIELLAKIIEAQGWRAPITVSSRSGFVVRGHGRLMAAQLLGLESVPVDRQEYESEAAEYADLIADNRLAELSNINNTLLAEMLKDTGEFAEFTGFTMAEIEDMIAEQIQEEPHEDDFDVAEEVANIHDSLSEEGDLWLLGKHRLMNGDSTSIHDMNSLLGGDMADMCFTDPPYNVAYTGGTAEALTIKNDSMSEEEFDDFLCEVFKRIYENIKDGAAVYVCHADSAGHTFRNNFVGAGLLLKQLLVWVKNTFVMGRQDYQWKHEPILYGWKPGASHKFYGGRKQSTVIDTNLPVEVEKQGDEFLVHLNTETDHVILKVPQFEVVHNDTVATDTVWRFNKPLRNGEHPTMKPIELCARGIQNSSKKGEIVLEPFGGSGSTLIAAEQTGRRCYAMELDPKYCEVIVKRYIKQVGTNANVYRVRHGKKEKYSSLTNDFDLV